MLKDGTHTYVFLLRPEGDGSFREEFASNVHKAIDFRKILDGRPYSIMHFKGWKNIAGIYNFTIPALRLFSGMRNDVFIFVLDEQRRQEYGKFIVKRAPSRLALAKKMNLDESEYYKLSPLGFTDMDKGVAFVREENYRAVRHEWAHLATCGTWHDDHAEDLPCDCIIKVENYKKLPWCDGS